MGTRRPSPNPGRERLRVAVAVGETDHGIVGCDGEDHRISPGLGSDPLAFVTVPEEVHRGCAFHEPVAEDLLSVCDVAGGRGGTGHALGRPNVGDTIAGVVSAGRIRRCVGHLLRKAPNDVRLVPVVGDGGGGVRGGHRSTHRVFAPGDHDRNRDQNEHGPPHKRPPFVGLAGSFQRQ